MKVDILAVGVHPDDVELACCGTLLRHIDLGYKVAILDLTQGELGTRGSAELRLQEATKASQLIGAVARINLGMADGFFENNKANQLDIIEIIRLLQPKIVLANATSDRHPDHGRASKLVADACFYSGLSKIKTTWEGVEQAAYRPKALYHYIQDYNLKADFVVDITGYMARKLDIILAYSSQFYQEKSNPNEAQTPISGKDFLDFIEAKARVYGREAGFEHAEGFVVNRNIGVQNLFNIL